MDESGQVYLCLFLIEVYKNHSGWLRHFVILQFPTTRNAILVESGHLHIKYTMDLLVESGHPPFDSDKL